MKPHCRVDPTLQDDLELTRKQSQAEGRAGVQIWERLRGYAVQIPHLRDD
jgi:hypothetical protein